MEINVGVVRRHAHGRRQRRHRKRSEQGYVTVLPGLVDELIHFDTESRGVPGCEGEYRGCKRFE